MAYLVTLGVAILSLVALLLWVAKLVFSPREIYRGASTAFGQVFYCRHCDAVVTRHNLHDHGVNCPQRPPHPAQRRRP